MLIVVLLVLACLPTTHARQVETADKHARAALANMPHTGRVPADFVPKHWVISTQAKGDLDGDGITDYAFSVTPNKDDPATKALTDEDGYLPPTHLIADPRPKRRR